MPDTAAPSPLHVVLVGGGIAALEAVLALHELAGDRVRMTLVAPGLDVTLRPLATAEPFARGGAAALPLTAVMAEHGGVAVRGAVLAVDPQARTLTLADGGTLDYDVLVLAQGVKEIPAFEHALTLGEHAGALGGILRDLEEGWSRSAAFVVPPGCAWTLPLYELALMTAEEVWAMNMDRVQLHLVTPEHTPLEAFGPAAGTELAALLRAARIQVHHRVDAAVPSAGHVDVGTGDDLVVDRVIALPRLIGRRILGIPTDADGFIPVSDAGLTAVPDVYAIGDVTARPIKQGGLACQQADVTAAHIAVRAGAPVEVPPLEQVLRGRLLTGGADRFLRRASTADWGTAADRPLWWPPVKISGRHLTPYLDARGIIDLPVHKPQPPAGLDVEVDLGPVPSVGVHLGAVS